MIGNSLLDNPPCSHQYYSKPLFEARLEVRLVKSEGKLDVNRMRFYASPYVLTCSAH